MAYGNDVDRVRVGVVVLLLGCGSGPAGHPEDGDTADVATDGVDGGTVTDAEEPCIEPRAMDHVFVARYDEGSLSWVETIADEEAEIAVADLDGGVVVATRYRRTLVRYDAAGLAGQTASHGALIQDLAVGADRILYAGGRADAPGYGAYDASLSPIWVPGSVPGSRAGRMHVAPLAHGGAVVVTSSDDVSGTVTSIDATGAPTWSVGWPAMADPAPFDHLMVMDVAAFDDGSIVLALDSANGLYDGDMWLEVLSPEGQAQWAVQRPETSSLGLVPRGDVLLAAGDIGSLGQVWGHLPGGELAWEMPTVIPEREPLLPCGPDRFITGSTIVEISEAGEVVTTETLQLDLLSIDFGLDQEGFDGLSISTEAILCGSDGGIFVAGTVKLGEDAPGACEGGTQ